MKMLGEFPDKKLETLQLGIIIITVLIRNFKEEVFKKRRVVNSIKN